MGARSQYGPAAGAKGGAKPRLAALRVPSFIRLDAGELAALYDVFRDPLVSHVFTLLAIGADFTSGELLTTYARLMDLCTPPRPQNGPRRPGPSYKQLRRAIDDLVATGLVVRGDFNESQGQLRLYITPRRKS